MHDPELSGRREWYDDTLHCYDLRQLYLALGHEPTEREVYENPGLPYPDLYRKRFREESWKHTLRWCGVGSNQQLASFKYHHRLMGLFQFWVLQRDHYTCQYCLTQGAPKVSGLLMADAKSYGGAVVFLKAGGMHVHHIIAQQCNGPDALWNLTCACRSCNCSIARREVWPPVKPWEQPSRVAL